MLFPPRASERLVRETSPDALIQYYAPRVVTAYKEEAVALLPYKHPLVQATIVENKFHNNEKAQDMLTEVLV